MHSAIRRNECSIQSSAVKQSSVWRAGEPGRNGSEFRIKFAATRKLITAATIFLFASPTFAQQTHNQYEPPNGLGAGQKLLAQFVGDWDVVRTFFSVNGQAITTLLLAALSLPEQLVCGEVEFHLLRAKRSKPQITRDSAWPRRAERVEQSHFSVQVHTADP